jgi:protein subunit release factor B
MSKKELLFSVTAKDCDWDYFKGSGAGGQKRNKTSSAVRCTHRASKAVGQAEDTRSQLQNKKLAFRRMAETEKFRNWIKVEKSRRLGIEKIIKEEVEKSMEPKNLKTEVRDNEGKWIKVDFTSISEED